ncbi:MAG: DUF1800 domain-containing protein [Bacteroidetes bacterium]|nr:DUF1800 domain-containing protein [Bacteroidota bacterium]
MVNPLDPYIPSAGRPWNKKMVLHLLNRTTFGAKVSDINYFLTLTPDAAVEKLFEPYTLPDSPGAWISEPPDFGNVQTNYQRCNELRIWWAKLMYNQPPNLRELMTLFWHNHFTSSVTSVQIPQYLYIQNTMFRRFVFGNFKNLTFAINRDPAMLIYLDGALNAVGQPNENYSRELLELFTLGIGNYTETDIREGARALTGWVANGLGAQFVPLRHDYTNKTYFGQTGNWTDEDVINIVFQQPAAATFICSKFYKFFVNQSPDMTDAMPVINQLAEILRNNNFEIAPVLKTLLKSELFFSENVMGSLIKSPLQIMIGQLRQLNISLNASTINTNLNDLIFQGNLANQYILDPPNVRGWLGYRNWLNSFSLPVRNAFNESAITGIKKDNTPTGFSVDPIAFATSFPQPNNALQLVKDMSEHLIRLKISEKQLNYLLQVLLDGAIVQDWNISDPQAPNKIKKFLKAIIYMAEYQLY